MITTTIWTVLLNKLKLGFRLSLKMLMISCATLLELVVPQLGRGMSQGTLRKYTTRLIEAGEPQYPGRLPPHAHYSISHIYADERALGQRPILKA